MYAKSAAGNQRPAPYQSAFHTPGEQRKWRLQRAAQSILRDTETRVDRYGNDRAHYTYRVAMCHRGTDGMAPMVRRMATGERAEYYGLQTCGSVWTCPICAAKIANHRRDKMRAAMAAHLEKKGMVFLATYTFQHSADDAGAGCLEDRLTKLRELMRKLTASRQYKAIMEEAGTIGAIRAMEVTFGEMNGWHPHVHQLIFGDRWAVMTDGHGQTIYRRSILGRIRQLWARLLIKNNMAGLSRNDTPTERLRKLRTILTRCFTVQCGSYADAYIAKFGKESESSALWDSAAEMTKGHTKIPRRTNHTTPWGLLADFADGDKRAAWLFREYAAAFAGKAQLFWSRGLAAALGVDDDTATNEEIASTPESRCDEDVIQLTDDQWTLILSRNARYETLRAAARYGRMGVLALLKELGEMPPSHSGQFTRTSQAFQALRQ